MSPDFFQSPRTITLQRRLEVSLEMIAILTLAQRSLSRLAVRTALVDPKIRTVR
jgi:hypothetical protein